jgi:hypothetical protein
MKDRGIIFSGPMVRAILDGRKSMTRRLKGLEDVNRFPSQMTPIYLVDYFRMPLPGTMKCPYGQPGDRLWVRETWMKGTPDDILLGIGKRSVVYKTDQDADVWGNIYRWHPSIFMPRWASRILLEITDVKVDRIQEISEEDAKREGATQSTRFQGAGELISYRAGFADLWDSINKKNPWESNPFVWVISFKRINL